MSVRATKRTELVPPAVELLEEAVALLRQIPLSFYIPFLLGVIPWLAGILFFWSYATWFAPSAEEIIWCSLGLALGFGHLKVCQALFSHRLLEFRRGEAPQPFAWRDYLRVFAQQLRVQVWGLLALPVASVLALPLAWVMAFYQTDTVLALSNRAQANSRQSESGAWKLAQLWANQNHQGLGFLSLAGFVLWCNVMACFVAVPYLGIHLLGLRTFFGLTPTSLLNSSLVAATFLVSWACLDPLIKAFYVLRVFHGQARQTGADLRQRFGLPRSSAGATALLSVLAFLILAGTTSRLQARPLQEAESGAHPAEIAAPSKPTPAILIGSAGRAASAPAERAVKPADLDRSIQELLKDRSFSWRLRPRPEPETSVAPSENRLVRLLDKGVEMVKSFFRYLWDLLRQLLEWLRNSLSSNSAKGTTHFFSSTLEVVLWVLVVLLALLVLWLLFVLVGQLVKRKGRTELQSGVLLPAIPDLEDESVHAAQLPEEEWLRLARERLAAGDGRLACRALFLAQLARLGSRGRLRLARHKTNLDYEGELRRRAAGSEAELAFFSTRRRLFDHVWYGRREVLLEELRSWLSRLEGEDAI